VIKSQIEKTKNLPQKVKIKWRIFSKTYPKQICPTVADDAKYIRR